MNIQITGTVYNGSGQPVTGAAVQFVPMSPPCFVGSFYLVGDSIGTTSAADGTFAVMLLSGTYQMVVQTSTTQSVTTVVVPTSGGPYDVSVISAAPPIGLTWQPSNAGPPEGVVTGWPGWTCLDTTTNIAYMKKTGYGNTGWSPMVQL